MKTIILLLTFIPAIAFSQKIDLTKKQAFDAYKKSNIRKELGFKLKDFNYNLLVKKSKQYNVPLKNMVILNSTTDNELLLSTTYDYRRSLNKNELTEHCIFCEDIPYYDIKKKDFEMRDKNTPYK